MRPAVGVFHASSLTNANKVSQGLGSALLPLAITHCDASLNLLELTIYHVRDAVLDFVDVQTLRTGWAWGMDCEALRALAGALYVILYVIPYAFTYAVERPVADFLGEPMAAAVAHMV